MFILSFEDINLTYVTYAYFIPKGMFLENLSVTWCPCFANRNFSEGWVSLWHLFLPQRLQESQFSPPLERRSTPTVVSGGGG